MWFAGYLLLEGLELALKLRSTNHGSTVSRDASNMTWPIVAAADTAAVAQQLCVPSPHYVLHEILVPGGRRTAVSCHSRQQSPAAHRKWG